jgi:hypothetical protein
MKFLTLGAIIVVLLTSCAVGPENPYRKYYTPTQSVPTEYNGYNRDINYTTVDSIVPEQLSRYGVVLGYSSFRGLLHEFDEAIEFGRELGASQVVIISPKYLYNHSGSYMATTYDPIYTYSTATSNTNSVGLITNGRNTYVGIGNSSTNTHNSSVTYVPRQELRQYSYDIYSQVALYILDTNVIRAKRVYKNGMYSDTTFGSNVIPKVLLVGAFVYAMSLAISNND